MKIWLLTNEPSPYQVEFLSALHKDSDIDLSVRFMRATFREDDASRPAEDIFPYECLRGWGSSFFPEELVLHVQALREAWGGGEDLYVLSGHYTSVTFVACAWIMSWRKRPWVMWLEQPWPDDYRPAWSGRLSTKSGFARWFRSRLLKSLIAKSTGLFCIGRKARDAYVELGVEQGKCHILPYICDVQRFTDVPKREAQALREKLKLGNRTTYLYSGQLIARKGVDVLLKALELLLRDGAEVSFVILGDGPLRKELEDSLSTDVSKHVHFVGHVAQSELPLYFCVCDVFAIASRHDGWGVVLNEALGAGLPIIVTNSTGAARDLVEDGVNGFVVDRDDVHLFAERMRYFALHPEKIEQFGGQSFEKAKIYSLEEGVGMFIHAAKACIK